MHMRERAACAVSPSDEWRSAHQSDLLQDHSVRQNSHSQPLRCFRRRRLREEVDAYLIQTLCARYVDKLCAEYSTVATLDEIFTSCQPSLLLLSSLRGADSPSPSLPRSLLATVPRAPAAGADPRRWFNFYRLFHLDVSLSKAAPALGTAWAKPVRRGDFEEPGRLTGHFAWIERMFWKRCVVPACNFCLCFFIYTTTQGDDDGAHCWPSRHLVRLAPLRGCRRCRIDCPTPDAVPGRLIAGSPLFCFRHHATNPVAAGASRRSAR